jgi:2-polyprenyl-3-methyl-5-hydroxy-6-metoxy-1,4-benzoquinol methylase
MNKSFVKDLVETAAAPYRSAGRFAWNFAKGKLGGDPAFAGLLQYGLIPDGSRILDIGCGQGLLASWLLTARQSYEKGSWPVDWPAPPAVASLHGIELMKSDVERAQQALGNAARFTVGDMCKTDFGSVDAVVILDVLHYVDYAAQDDVLRRVKEALSPNGRLLLRVGDANGGWRFRCSLYVDHVVTWVRGHRNARLYCRPLTEWEAALKRLGFSVKPMPMNQGTPFANILLDARLA